MKYSEQGKKILDMEIDGLRRVRDNLGPDFDKAVEMMLRTLDRGGKIVATGIGKNLHIAQKLSATLASTGATSVMLNPTQAMHGDLGILSENDVLLALSYSGESDELLTLIPIVKRLGISIIALTGATDSALARSSDIAVPVTVPCEACPFNMAPTTSTTATLAAGDALAMVLLEARGVKKEEFARFHPGGAIGRALLLKVSDIMRDGKALVKVTGDTTVKEALFAMTRARSGSAAVTDNNGIVRGIFTDGDLRRRLADTPDLLDTPVEKVMTGSPITITPDMFAAEVLKIFQDNLIDDLLVVDEEGRLAGAVDIQDLPKLKVM